MYAYRQFLGSSVTASSNNQYVKPKILLQDKKAMSPFLSLYIFKQIHSHHFAVF